MYMPNSLWTWSFTAIALVQAIVCLALEAYVFAEFENSLTGVADTPDTRNTQPARLTIPTYLAIFIFGFVYQLALVWDGLRLRNTIQVIGICLYNLGMMVYASVEQDQVDQAVAQLGAAIDTNAWQYLGPCLIAVPCVLALGTVLLSFVAWKLYNEFAWTIYKQISADVRLKRRYLTYQIYIALLKFDFFFFVGFTVQFLVIVNGKLYELILTCIALGITVFLLFFAAWITRRESTIGQCFVIFLYFCGMAYFIFKMVRMYDSSMAIDYKPARHSLTTFAVITILLLVVTITTAVMCMLNFNKGLKPHIQNPYRKGAALGGEDDKFANNYPVNDYAGPGQHQLGNVGSRMTID